MHKIIFLDLDGTTLDSNKTIPAANRDAICRAIAAGHRVVLCTGRSISGVMPVATALGLDQGNNYLICFNGGVICDMQTGSAVYRRTVPADAAGQLTAAMDEAGLYWQFYDTQGVCARQSGPEYTYYTTHYRIPVELIPTLPAGMREAPVQINALTWTHPELLPPLRDRLNRDLSGRISAFLSEENILCCVADGVSKGNAAMELCRILGHPAAETVSAGDGDNDISMIRACGTGCAMANATAGCKEAADYITERIATKAVWQRLSGNFYWHSNDYIKRHPRHR